MTVIKTFVSKRNIVKLIEEDGLTFVEKHFMEKEDFLRECKYYKLLKDSNFKTPKVFEIGKEQLAIKLEYIEGITLLESLESLEKTADLHGAVDLISTLLSQLISMEKELNCHYRDVNFRNFLLLNQEIYFLDFEAIDQGRSNNLAAHVFAYYLLYNPIKTTFKHAVVDKCIEKLGKNSIKSDVLKCVEAIEKRRGM